MIKMVYEMMTHTDEVFPLKAKNMKEAEKKARSKIKQLNKKYPNKQYYPIIAREFGN